jgi:SNF2-related domain/Protein of unknown function (DUF1524)
VDPLPHQLEAVYDYLLKLARVRFLLADDAGAGKTIMAGLLIRELKLRGLAERVLVICPANLTFQWQRELKEKFEEKFVVLKGDLLREQFGINQWLETPMVITSLDLAKRENILPGLKQVRWDLVIVDEAHRMSWTPPSKKTARYALGELLTNGLFVHRLGNLMMLPPGINSKLKDLLPNQKAATYAEQGLLQAIEVSKLIRKRKWNREAAQKREKHLIRWATKEWSR